MAEKGQLGDQGGSSPPVSELTLGRGVYITSSNNNDGQHATTPQTGTETLAAGTPESPSILRGMVVQTHLPPSQEEQPDEETITASQPSSTPRAQPSIEEHSPSAQRKLDWAKALRGYVQEETPSPKRARIGEEPIHVPPTQVMTPQQPQERVYPVLVDSMHQLNAASAASQGYSHAVVTMQMLKALQRSAAFCVQAAREGIQAARVSPIRTPPSQMPPRQWQGPSQRPQSTAAASVSLPPHAQQQAQSGTQQPSIVSDPETVLALLQIMIQEQQQREQEQRPPSQ